MDLKPCSGKDLVKRMKAQATDWEKIVASHISDKGLCRIHKNFNNSTVKKNPIRKWAKNMNRRFTEEGKPTANKHVKDVQHH